ncbi:hypothetical protein B9Z65_1832 [Elsinoe australis]|uniref:20S-pre-rRNA D-site endonuclease NOB1 n=1 Tax=Elsinoe australis TaxID=40998 RepID=A0A2P7YL10_9PEZI|nr:hypothetical protein B9Z65_1832 [Elsinoe australis]
MAAEKPIHTLVLDTGPIIRNHPTVSSLLAQSEELITVPAIISEIKDAVTRSRVETTLIPFLKLRSPNESSIKFVTEFARKTGDAAVLSKVDLQIAALAYEVECERNEGDWRLRRVPGQKRVNGSPPTKNTEQATPDSAAEPETVAAEPLASAEPVDETIFEESTTSIVESVAAVSSEEPTIATEEPQTQAPDAPAEALASEPETADDISSALAETSLEKMPAPEADTNAQVDSTQPTPDDSPETDSSDGGEWITPSNLKKKQATDSGATSTTTAVPRMQVATLTTDNALQNLLLQINLNLLSSSLSRISQIRTTLLRCHACFLIHKQPNLQFCQRCGKPTLTRVTCTTSSSGEVKVHLKKNMQWSSRGERYSIPKPVHGSSNGRIKGGGKNGWGNGLVLAEDQKEYMRHEERRKRDEGRGGGKGIGALDEDYLPGILTGRREGRQGGRMKVGAGRDVNARKR